MNNTDPPGCRPWASGSDCDVPHTAITATMTTSVTCQRVALGHLIEGSYADLVAGRDLRAQQAHVEAPQGGGVGVEEGSNAANQMPNMRYQAPHCVTKHVLHVPGQGVVVVRDVMTSLHG